MNPIASRGLRQVGDLVLHVLKNSFSQVRRTGEEFFELRKENLIGRTPRLNKTAMQR